MRINANPLPANQDLTPMLAAASCTSQVLPSRKYPDTFEFGCEFVEIENCL